MQVITAKNDYDVVLERLGLELDMDIFLKKLWDEK